MIPALASLYGQLQTQPWLIDATAHAALLSAIEHASETAGVIEDLLAERDRVSAMSVYDGVAEIPIVGPLKRGAGPMEKILLGVTDTDAVSAKVAQAALRPDVRSILLTIDSPGGSIGGLPELAAQINDAAGKKPIVAFTDGVMGSAAYWLGSQASMIVASQSSNVGSIGVYVPYTDTSGRAAAMGVKVGIVKNTGGTYKGMGHPGTSLTEAQLAYMQERVDEIFGMFKGSILSKRPNVKASAMQGQTFFGQSAKAAGLVDVVASHVEAWGHAHRLATGGKVMAAAATSREALIDQLADQLKTQLIDQLADQLKTQLIDQLTDQLKTAS